MASTYPKLEVIVLDDGSSDNTSILIKSFAHAGVRFVEGTSLPNGWLGKNHALHGLLGEASGKYVVFMDVDTSIAPDSIAQLVAYAQQEAADMVSVLPQRVDELRASIIFSTLRYFWELVLHRNSRPAAASAAWLIDRRVLQHELHGFYPYKSDVQPEARIAAELYVNDRYRFLISSPQLGINYEKKWSSQIETGIRLLLPRFGHSIPAGLVALLGLFVVWSPLAVIISALFMEWSLFHSAAIWQVASFMGMYGLYLEKTRRRHWFMGMVLWPYILTQEIVLLMMSMISYARGTVTWKGRPVSVR